MRSLVDARLQLHHAAQIPAAVGSSLLAAEPDWAHLSLAWVERAGALASRPTGVGRPFRIGLALESVALVRLDPAGDVLDRYALTGRTPAEALAWAEAATGASLTPPAHDLPAHAVADGGPWTLAPGFESGALARRYAEAARALQPLGPPVRTWPHHFDTAALILLDPELGAEESRSINVGMSPGDGSYAEPYWYVTPWPAPTTEALPELAGEGRWHRDGWVGAVLEAERVASETAERERQVDDFVRSAIEAGRALLGS